MKITGMNTGSKPTLVIEGEFDLTLCKRMPQQEYPCEADNTDVVDAEILVQHFYWWRIDNNFKSKWQATKKALRYIWQWKA